MTFNAMAIVMVLISFTISDIFLFELCKTLILTFRIRQDQT